MLPVPVLYGGSVKPENAAELAAQPDVDGALVGGASARSGIVRRDLPRSVPLVALVILDGWGCAPPGPGNAVALADTPVFDRLWQRYPHTTLDASGEAAGLPAGQMGNSEVGHLTIGSGRRLLQDLQRVNSAIADGSLARSPVLAGGVRAWAARPPARARLPGRRPLAHRPSPALLELAPDRTWIHAFTDGRDVSPHSALTDLATLPQNRIATVIGRYYAMDRDNRLDRTARAAAALLEGAGHRAASPLEAVQASYEAGVTDEFIEPVVIDGTPRIEPGDTAIFFNFRPDRGRQLAAALLAAGVDLTTMTRYGESIDCPIVLGEQTVAETLAETLARARGAPAARRRDGEVRARHVLLQRRRRAGVGGRDPDPRPEPAGRAELRLRARHVGARSVAERFCDAIGDGYGFAVVNFANPDMVGHTGVDPRRRRGGRGDGRLPRPRRRMRGASSAASASSPPTTGTPSSCSRPTASRRTRPTRRTACR